MPEPIRVRFAPSPTGYLHVGGARTALFNWLLARRHGGVFVLRIEDTDRERSNAAMTDAILHGMTWLGLTWDEGPFHQADGFARHQADAQRMLEGGRAYRCFCTKEELDVRRAAAEAAEGGYRYDRRCLAIPRDQAESRAAAGEPFTLRFQVPEGSTAWQDEVHGETRFPNEHIEDFIILRTDGTPIYNLAVVSDDIEMRITHVIRGDDHLSNTPKQILLYQALGAAVPSFAHLPMILGPDGKRLSKRHGATAVGEYEGQGILPEALNNFLALLGWNPGNDLEVMTMDEMVERFSLDRVNKKSAVFDPEKLAWMNSQHFWRRSGTELAAQVVPLLVERGALSADDAERDAAWLADLLEMLKLRAKNPQALAELAASYVGDRVEYDPAATAKHWKDAEEATRFLRAAHDAFAALPAWEPAALEQALRDTAESLGAGFGKLVHPLRIAVTGSAASPGIDQVLAVMGRQRILNRICYAVEYLNAAQKQ
jgi:glutamyl-tRNA synthetase